MLYRCLCLFAFVALSSAACDTTWPNSTETKVTWWQCSSGPVMVTNVNPTDKKGVYEYPIRLTEPLLIATTVNDPSSTYSSPGLKQTIKVWSWNMNSCSWTGVPTFGLLNNIDACTNGVPCPIRPGNNQIINLELDFSDTPAIINLLHNDKPYQLEYMLHDDVTNEDLCIIFQARALTK
uniref:ML domain-containing protein n=1 Tax=Caenorhabditis tropicalis TaxID=1561998 RepID=A0A1I7TEX7_9PELO